MANVTIYHNPRCSKSRQTLALLQEQGFEPTVVEYLRFPPSVSDLRHMLALLGLRPLELMRTKEPIFQELGIGDWDTDAPDYDDQLIAAMAQRPKLIERPIVVTDTAARIGRPPERVLEIL